MISGSGLILYSNPGMSWRCPGNPLGSFRFGIIEPPDSPVSPEGWPISRHSFASVMLLHALFVRPLPFDPSSGRTTGRRKRATPLTMFSGMFHPITSSSLSLVPSGPGIGIVTVGGMAPSSMASGRSIDIRPPTICDRHGVPSYQTLTGSLSPCAYSPPAVKSDRPDVLPLLPLLQATPPEPSPSLSFFWCSFSNFCG
jgi:hypothetical protein